MAGAVGAGVREELAALEAAGDELSKRAAAALQTLLDDLGKAHADAASHAVNNEQRFHQLEQETIAARSEAERVGKLKEDAERKREQAEARIGALTSEVSAAVAKADHAAAELRKVAQQADQAKRDKEELVWAQDRHVQDAERAKAEAAQLRQHAKEREQERLQLMKDLDEAREKALSVQSQLNAANTTLKYTEAELKQTGERLSEKSEALSKHLGESQATIARQERELASERAETERLSAASEEWKKSAQQQSEAVQRQIEKAQASAQENLATQTSLQMDLDNKTKLLQLAKRAQEDAEKEVARVQAHSAMASSRLQNVERVLQEERSESKSKAEQLEQRAQEAEDKLKAAEAKLQQMVSIGETPGGNSELLQKILASSPAAVAAEFVREGRTAEVYKVLEDTCELLHKERHERVRAEECLAEVVKELQDKGPAILRQRQEWESAIHANQATNSKLEAALAEMQTLRGQVKEIKVQRDRTMQDAASLERHNADLTAQCQALLRTVEEYREQLASPAVQRAVMISTPGQAAAAGAAAGAQDAIGKGTDAQSYITNQLVTFRNVEELQTQNEKLLKVVRQLSQDMDREAEVRKEELRAEYATRIEDALREVQEIRRERDVLEADKRSLAQQRDMYRILLAEADRSFVQPDDDSAAPPAEARASGAGGAGVAGGAGGVGGGGSSEVVSPPASRTRQTADAVRKVQSEMKELRERSEAQTSVLRAELSAMREEKTKSTLACAQAQSDSSFLKERMESLRATNDALTQEVGDLRTRVSGLQAQLGVAEGKLSEHIKEASSASHREQTAREGLVVAEAARKHAEDRITQLQADLAALKTDKAQIHTLLSSYKTMHEEDAKRYTDDLARANTDRERKEKDWTEARAELTKERARVDELRYTSEHKMSELRAAVRKAEESVSDLRTDKIRLEADCKAAQERVTLLERQLESAEARFRDALLYQQRAADTQASPGKTPGDGSPGAVRSGGGVGGAIGGEEVAVMSSRLLALESEKSALEKQLADLKIHRDNWHTMATQNEEALRVLRADVEARRSNADTERQKLEALLAEKTAMASSLEQAAHTREEKMLELRRECDTLKQGQDAREGSLKNSITQLELERDGLKQRLALTEEETGRLDDLRKQALTDYEREVSQHATKLEELREVRAKMQETEDRSRQAVAAAEQARNSLQREAAADAEAKRLLESKVQDLEQKLRDSEERNTLLDQQLQHLDREKEARLAALTGADSPQKRAAGDADDMATEQDTDSEKQLREMREHLRRLKHKADLAEYRLLDAETELAREKQRAEQDRREVGELRSRLQVEEARNTTALSSQQQFDQLQEQVQTLSVFKESNAQLRTDAEDARKKLDQSQAKLKEVEAQLMPLRQAQATLQTRLSVMESDAKQLKEELERWKARATELSDKHGGAGVDPVEHEQLRAEAAALKAQATAEQQATANAAAARDAALNEAEKLRADLKTAQDAINAQPAAPAAAAALTPEAVKASETYQNLLNKAKQDATRMIEKTKKSKADLARTEAELQAVREELSSKDAELATLKEAAPADVSAAAASISPEAMAEVEAAKVALEAEVGKLKVEIAALTQQTGELTAAKTAADNAAAEAKADVARLTGELDAEKAARTEDAKKSMTKMNQVLKQMTDQRTKAEAEAVKAQKALATKNKPAQVGTVGAMAGTKRAATEASLPASAAATTAGTPSAVVPAVEGAAPVAAPPKRGRVGAVVPAGTPAPAASAPRTTVAGAGAKLPLKVMPTSQPTAAADKAAAAEVAAAAAAAAQKALEKEEADQAAAAAAADAAVEQAAEEPVVAGDVGVATEEEELEEEERVTMGADGVVGAEDVEGVAADGDDVEVEGGSLEPTECGAAVDTELEGMDEPGAADSAIETHEEAAADLAGAADEGDSKATEGLAEGQTDLGGEELVTGMDDDAAAEAATAADAGVAMEGDVSAVEEVDASMVTDEAGLLGMAGGADGVAMEEVEEGGEGGAELGEELMVDADGAQHAIDDDLVLEEEAPVDEP